MTDAELAGHIRNLRGAGTDHRHVEAKRSQQGIPRRLWETLSAFSNSPGGGTIILGLDEKDGFAAAGVDDPGRVQADLQSMCAEMEPRVAATIDLKEVEGKYLVIAEVPELLAAQKPCYHRASGLQNGAFVRQGDADRKLGPYEVHVLLSARGQPADDQEPVAGSSGTDLDHDAVQAFLRRVRERRPRFRDRRDEEILRTLKVLVPDPVSAGAYVPSLAGMLVFGREPQSFFPQFALLFTAFPGRSLEERGPAGERVLDDARIEGNLGVMVNQAVTRIVGNLRQPRRDAGVGRTTEPEIPRTAISEALVNALAHRDLSALARGTAVQVRLFTDRLTITSPGGLHGPVNVEALGTEGLSSARNATLMQILEDAIDPATGVALAEHRGTGISAMIESLRAAEMTPPRFEDRIADFRVTFPRQSLVDADVLSWLAALGAGAHGLTRSQRVALALLRGGETMTNARYRQVSGVDSRVATRELTDLADRGLIEMSGSRRWAEYSLAAGRPGNADNAAVARDPDRVRRTRADRRPDIRRLLLERGTLTRDQIEASLGLHQTTVGRWLKRMRLEGEVAITTGHEKDPNARYELLRAPVPERRRKHPHRA